MFVFAVIFMTVLSRNCLVQANEEERTEKRIELSNPSYVEQQICHFKTEIRDLHAKIEDFQTAIPEKDRRHGGVLFTRWGHTECPQNISTRVYAGYAGGSFFRHTGAASDYTCLPEHPTWGHLKDHDYSAYTGYMYGAEYETPNIMFGVDDRKEDVPCAVCVGSPYSMVLMIPGRVNCYPTWIEAYHGNLVSGRHLHDAASEYACMDEAPQNIPDRSEVNDNGKLFYGVKTVCGSLPCPPYENNKYLGCVVCMK